MKRLFLLITKSASTLSIRDRFGRTVAEVYANGQLVQLQQVKDGMVWKVLDRFKGNCPSWNEIEKAFAEVRSNRKGIFGEIRFINLIKHFYLWQR
jgi:endonuclease YncB( thermonuclease family)